MTQKERMEAGLVYDPRDEEIMDEQSERLELMHEFNSSRPSETAKCEKLFKRMLGRMGEPCCIEPRLRANGA